ncbi:Protein kinase-like domain superfamily [Arabidopsis thaliana x Arabidopsis arenosa]|uniref:Serine/threonine-protein kinase BSK n=1 Tax=Arabidopsis thaliana x Arabidopsis arenosa TaxID=1240361 RepID=A0A8T2B0C1_9BRAS|nr:Protein kinase-like domain superfamily [Arabidopsis thaliana x Arabidopsis arenosa]
MGGCCFSKPLENVQPPQQSQNQLGGSKNDEVKNDGFINWPFTEFFLSDLTTATKNFSSDEIISENAEESSNVVYKCRLSENLGFVAVKRFKNTPWPDHEDFGEEAQEVGELKHKRLVKLLGYCCDEEERLLVAEFMPNDTLAKRLFHQKNQTMEWSMRLRVAYHIAEALEYCSSAGFAKYDNLSASTVLFDKDDDACLSCFGLVREIIDYDRRTTGSVNTGNVTYRFGTILLNLLTGVEIPPSHAPEMINGKDITDLMDPNLKGKFSKEEATVILNLASDCLQCTDRKSLITEELVATLEALQTKTQVPSSDMPEITKQQEEASSSSQQQ